MIDKKPFGIHAANNVSFMNNKILRNMFFDGAAFLTSALQKYGMVLKKKIAFKLCPQKCIVICNHRSEALSALLGYMLKESDNLYADCIFKKIGAVCYRHPGTWQKGINATTQFLQVMYGDTTCNFVMKDGSGRSRYNLVSPPQITSLLIWVYGQKYFSLFVKFSRQLKAM